MTDRTVPPAVARVFTHRGPFVTVYLDASRTSASGEHEVALHWRGLREQLVHDGADAPSLDALDAAVAETDTSPGAHGRVLVAAHGQLLFDAALPDPPTKSTAHTGPLPHLVPYLARSAPRLAHVVVLAGHAGADVVAVPADTAATGQHPGSHSVDGTGTYPLHKTGRNTWDERHFQNRVDNSWATNAREVADDVRREVDAVGAELVVLAGDPRARALLREQLPAQLGPAVQVTETDVGARGRGSAGESLDDAVRSLVLQQSWQHRRDVLEHLRQNLGRDRYAVAGIAQVTGAVRRSQVDTVVLSDNPASTLTAWIGPEPLQLALSADEVRDMGVAAPEQARFDAALLRAVAGSGASLVVTPNAHDYVTDGIAALLRYENANGG